MDNDNDYANRLLGALETFLACKDPTSAIRSWEDFKEYVREISILYQVSRDDALLCLLAALQGRPWNSLGYLLLLEFIHSMSLIAAPNILRTLYALKLHFMVLAFQMRLFLTSLNRSFSVSLSEFQVMVV